ncbi:MAG: hypothetical protein WDO56_20975 [Gammaproteobacteria bacterium]
MSPRSNKAAWAAAGIFTVGAVTGLAAPAFLRAHAGPESTAAATTVPAAVAASVAQASVGNGPIPLVTAPNYRAIVAQNSAAVVGISIVGETKVANRGPFGGGKPLRRRRRQPVRAVLPQPAAGRPWPWRGPGRADAVRRARASSSARMD